MPGRIYAGFQGEPLFLLLENAFELKYADTNTSICLFDRIRVYARIAVVQTASGMLARIISYNIIESSYPLPFPSCRRRNIVRDNSAVYAESMKRVHVKHGSAETELSISCAHILH